MVSRQGKSLSFKNQNRTQQFSLLRSDVLTFRGPVCTHGEVVAVRMPGSMKLKGYEQEP